jgi:hypothetical protein
MNPGIKKISEKIGERVEGRNFMQKWLQRGILAPKRCVPSTIAKRMNFMA